MKKILTVLTGLLFLVVSCSKDKLATKPRIEVNSYSTREVPFNGQLIIRLNYFDKEGDLANGDFWLARYRTNRRPLGPTDANRADTLDAAHGYALPDFPNEPKAEIALTFDYQTFLKESVFENDTIYFRIAVADKAGNKSDTITTDQIVILK